MNTEPKPCPFEIALEAMWLRTVMEHVPPELLSELRQGISPLIPVNQSTGFIKGEILDHFRSKQ